MAGQFRIVVFGEGRAPWRTSREDAMSDAKALGLAAYDRSLREWFLAVPVAMERRGHANEVKQQRDRRGAPWTHAELIEMRTLAARGECLHLVGRRMGRTARAIRSKARAAHIDITMAR